MELSKVPYLIDGMDSTVYHERRVVLPYIVPALHRVEERMG